MQVDQKRPKSGVQQFWCPQGRTDQTMDQPEVIRKLLNTLKMRWNFPEYTLNLFGIPQYCWNNLEFFGIILKLFINHQIGEE